MASKSLKLKSRFFEALKWIFSGGLLYYLFQSGKLSPSDIQNFLSHPKGVALGVLVMFLTLLVAFARWRLILSGLGIHLDYFSTLRLGMLGQFFSSIIPGSVGGDLVKGFYIARRFPDRRALALSTVFLDRVLGLATLIFLGAIAFLLGKGPISQISRAESLVVISFGWALIGLSAGILSALLLFTFFSKRLPEEPGFLKQLPFLSRPMRSLYQILLAYKDNTMILWKVIAISCVVHVGNVALLHICATTIFGPGPWGQILWIPFILGTLLGNCSLAVPLAPMGLGVGQVAFATIFYGIGASDPNFGAAIVTAAQIVTLIANLTGSLFYVTYRHEIQTNQTQPSEMENAI